MKKGAYNNKDVLKDNPEVAERLDTFLKVGREMSGKRRPTNKQIKVITEIALGNSPTNAVRNAGYAPATIDKPQVVLNSRGLANAIETLTRGKDEALAGKILDLMEKSSRVDTLYLPYMPKQGKTETKEAYDERVSEIISDKEITSMLLEVGGIVKKISNSISGRIVYYLFPDATAQIKAFDLIAKIKGSFAPNKTENENRNYNFSPAMLRKELEKRRQKIIDVTSK